MWTFLGIVSFTYLYKKLDALLAAAPLELVLAAALCLSAGLLLSYVRYFHQFRLPQALRFALSLLGSIPGFQRVAPRIPTWGKDNTYKEVRRLVSSVFCSITPIESHFLTFLLFFFYIYVRVQPKLLLF